MNRRHAVAAALLGSLPAASGCLTAHTWKVESALG